MVHLARTGGTKMYSFCYAPSPPHFSLRPFVILPITLIRLRRHLSLFSPSDTARTSESPATKAGSADQAVHLQQSWGLPGQGPAGSSGWGCQKRFWFPTSWRDASVPLGRAGKGPPCTWHWAHKWCKVLPPVGTCPKWILWEDTGRLPHMDGGD